VFVAPAAATRASGDPGFVHGAVFGALVALAGVLVGGLVVGRWGRPR
jgi:hypothetical protein